MRARAWLALALLLAGCGGPAALFRPPATHTPNPARDAKSVARDLQAAGLPIDGVIGFDAANDPYGLMGRPHQYSSSAAFHDSRRPNPKPNDRAIDYGGIVEVFANEDDRQARQAALDALSKSSPLFVEYDYGNGQVLVRLTSLLTPEQVAPYRDEIAKLR